MTHKIGVYLIENKITGEFYGGSSLNLNRRWSHHKSSVISKRFMCPKLHRAMEKDGIDNFQFKPLLYCDSNVLEMYEQRWLDKNVKNPKCYNIAIDAKHEWRGVKFTDDHKKNISVALKGHRCSDSTRQKISNAHKGKTVSIETKMKLSTIGKGRTPSALAIEGVIKFNRNRVWTEELRRKVSNSMKLYHQNKNLVKLQVK